VAVMRLKPEGLWPSASKRRELRIDAETLAVQQGTAVPKQKTA
jgi:branched-chain amino acid transport system permease protein